MTFQTARNRYNEIRAQLRAGRIDLEQFGAQVRELRLQDQQGIWWCISAENSGWLRWDGAAWQPAQPPTDELASPQVESPPQQTSAPSRCPQCQAPLRAGRKFCGKCGASTATEPLGMDGVPAGAPSAEIVIPAAPSAGKRGAGGGAAKWGRRTWNVFSLGGCTVVSGLWYWYSGMADTAPDYKTCATIILLPLITIVLRSQIDRLLRPLQKVFGGIPRMVRLGIGLAIPLLTANYMYAAGFSNFEYLFRTVLFSTVLSYLLLRVPSPIRTIVGHAARRIR